MTHEKVFNDNLDLFTLNHLNLLTSKGMNTNA